MRSRTPMQTLSYAHNKFGRKDTKKNAHLQIFVHFSLKNDYFAMILWKLSRYVFSLYRKEPANRHIR